MGPDVGLKIAETLPHLSSLQVLDLSSESGLASIVCRVPIVALCVLSIAFAGNKLECHAELAKALVYLPSLKLLAIQGDLSRAFVRLMLIKCDTSSWRACFRFATFVASYWHILRRL